jgi:hypothetical protein
MILNFFVFILETLGTTLFAGTFYSCRIAVDTPSYVTALVKDRNDCLNQGGDWINADHNFDNHINSAITLTIFGSTEGWVNVMWDSVDAVGPEIEPVYNYSRPVIILYVVLVFFISLLFGNLIIGIVIGAFNIEKEKIMRNGLLDPMEK